MVHCSSASWTSSCEDVIRAADTMMFISGGIMTWVTTSLSSQDAGQ